jgi:hypothetical protein
MNMFKMRLNPMTQEKAVDVAVCKSSDVWPLQMKYPMVWHCVTKLMASMSRAELPQIQRVAKQHQNSSAKEAGFFSQNMYAYLVIMTASWKRKTTHMMEHLKMFWWFSCKNK